MGNLPSCIALRRQGKWFFSVVSFEVKFVYTSYPEGQISFCVCARPLNY